MLKIPDNIRSKFKHHCFPAELILSVVYMKCRFSLSYRDLEELISMRDISVDHATIQRWVYKFVSLIADNVKKRRKRVHGSWRVDETYIKIKGKWCYLYRAVDKYGDTIDFLLRKNRNKAAARQGLRMKKFLDIIYEILEGHRIFSHHAFYRLRVFFFSFGHNIECPFS